MEREDTARQISLRQIVSVVLKRWWIVLLAALLCAAASILYTAKFVTPIYQANALIYVNSSSVSLGSISVSTSNLTTSHNLISTYRVILKSRLTLNEVARRVNDTNLTTDGQHQKSVNGFSVPHEGAYREYNYKNLSEMISADAVEDTGVMKIIVSSPDPEDAALIANTIKEVLPEMITGIIEGTSVSPVDEAIIPEKPSSPSYQKNAVIGFVIGFVLSALFFLVLDLFVHDTIDSEDWIKENFGETVPLLATIPALGNQKHGGYGYDYGSSYYGYGYSSHRRKEDAPEEKNEKKGEDRS